MSDALIIERNAVSLTFDRGSAALVVERQAGKAIIIERAAVTQVNVGGGGGGGPPFVHTQSIAASEWIVNHNLGFRPAVTLFTVGGVEMEGEVIHSTLNQFRALFNTPLAGTAQGQ